MVPLALQATNSGRRTLMKKRFPGHYDLAASARKRLWDAVLFVFDASALLNLYGFSPKARDDLIGLLEDMKEALWIPHQFAMEYQRNRRKVIRDGIGVYRAVAKMLEEAEQQFSAKAKELLDRERFVRVEVKEALASVFQNRVKALKEHRGRHGELLDDDRYHQKIDQAVRGPHRCGTHACGAGGDGSDRERALRAVHPSRVGRRRLSGGPLDQKTSRARLSNTRSEIFRLVRSWTAPGSRQAGGSCYGRHEGRLVAFGASGKLPILSAS